MTENCCLDVIFPPFTSLPFLYRWNHPGFVWSVLYSLFPPFPYSSFLFLITGFNSDSTCFLCLPASLSVCLSVQEPSCLPVCLLVTMKRIDQSDSWITEHFQGFCVVGLSLRFFVWNRFLSSLNCCLFKFVFNNKPPGKPGCITLWPKWPTPCKHLRSCWPSKRKKCWIRIIKSRSEK